VAPQSARMAVGGAGGAAVGTILVLIATQGTACGRTGIGEGAADASNSMGDDVVIPNACESESGWAICRGANDCPVPANDCPFCTGDPDAVGLCASPRSAAFCPACDDGYVCIQPYAAQSIHVCLPFDVGQLYASSGSADRVRYADQSHWTGQPLPEPSDCGDGGMPLCGGLCDPCAAGSLCVGRSPLHPYGFCVPSPYGPCSKGKPDVCGSGKGCVIFTDPPSDQAVADQNGLCVPINACEALGHAYPGGATCAGPD